VKKEAASVKIRKEVKILSQRGTAVPGQCRCGEVRVEIDIPRSLGLARSFGSKPAFSWHRDELVDWRDDFDLV
jgi:hypothetical protein